MVSFADAKRSPFTLTRYDRPDMALFSSQQVQGYPHLSSLAGRPFALLLDVFGIIAAWLVMYLCFSL